jgi:peptidoglycan/LPS O-acetylase OafA/YrhL
VSWTLFLEIGINVVHGFWLRRLGDKVLKGLLLLFALALCASVIHYKNENAGADWGTLLTGGVPRIAFSYFCGMALFRLWRRRSNDLVPALRMPPIVLICLTGVTLVIPTPHEAVVALAITLLWLPLLVYFSAFNEPGEWTKASFGLLGTASYAIYLFHQQLFLAVSMAWSGAEAHPEWAGYVISIALVLLSLLLDKVYDTPVRNWLKS